MDRFNELKEEYYEIRYEMVLLKYDKKLTTQERELKIAELEKQRIAIKEKLRKENLIIHTKQREEIKRQK